MGPNYPLYSVLKIGKCYNKLLNRWGRKFYRRGWFCFECLDGVV